MRLACLTLALSGLMVLGGCGSSSSPGGADAGVQPDGAAGADYQLTCESGATTFPPLDKSCTQASDCAVVTHTISCCGSQIAIGLASGSVGAFNTAEATCDAGYPGCGCAALPTKAEDGHDNTDGVIAVRCEQHRCMTYVTSQR